MEMRLCPTDMSATQPSKQLCPSVFFDQPFLNLGLNVQHILLAPFTNHIEFLNYISISFNHLKMISSEAILANTTTMKKEAEIKWDLTFVSIASNARQTLISNHYSYSNPMRLTNRKPTRTPVSSSCLISGKALC